MNYFDETRAKIEATIPIDWDILKEKLFQLNDFEFLIEVYKLLEIKNNSSPNNNAGWESVMNNDNVISRSKNAMGKTDKNIELFLKFLKKHTINLKDPGPDPELEHFIKENNL